jgi:hypothetical protein
MVVAASRDAADDFARSIAVERGASFGIHCFSLIQIASRLASVDLARRGVVPGTALGMEALASRTVFEAKRRTAVDYFETVADFPGFSRAVSSTVSDLRRAGVSPDRLIGLGPAGDDLRGLATQFEHERRSALLADTSELFETATRVLEGPAPPGDVAVATIVLLDVRLGSVIERSLVGALVRRSLTTLATVPQGDTRTRDAFLEMGGRELCEPDGGGLGSGIERLRSQLFATGEIRSGNDSLPEADVSDVQFFSAPGEARESVEIARRALEFARGGLAFDRMAILVRAPAVYAGPLETALRRAEIPAYFSRGTRRPDPAGRAFLALLACAAERLSARRFAEYLSLAQVPDAGPDGAPPIRVPRFVPPTDEALGPAADPRSAPVPPSQPKLPFDAEAAAVAHDMPAVRQDQPVVGGTLRAPWRWERLLVEAAVIGGRDRWARRLGGLEAELTLKLRTLQTDEPGSSRIAAVERQLEHLGHLGRFALPVIDRLAGLPDRATWGEWLAALRALVPIVLRRPNRILSVLAELQPMSEVGPVGLAEVREVLTGRLAELDQEPAAHRFGCIFIGTPEQARGHTFDVVFVPGLAERMFPQKMREDPILLDQARERIGGLLTTAEDRLAQERLLLHLAVGAASERLCFSYPRMGLELGEARPRVPSFYALDVVHATSGTMPSIDAFERAAAAVSGARLAWPAPADPQQAIDDFEHDLAVLEPFLHGTDHAGRGRARYLLELNAHLTRSLRTRWAREHRAWSPYDGVVRVTDETRPALARHRLDARAYSVSALQQYAACPYRFLLSSIYRLEPREEPVALEQIDPLTKGSIFHQVQAELMRELERTGRLPITPATIAECEEALDRTLTHVAEERRDELAPAIHRVWQDGIESIGADLRVWLRKMCESAERWRPIRFELGFGMPPDIARDPRSVRDPVRLGDRYRLHGVIDLLEERCGSTELRVTDYKTGRNTTAEILLVGKGETLQPVLYSLAVEAALGARVEEARLFFCTSKGNFTERVVTIDDLARRHGLVVLETIDAAVRDGALMPAPRAGACGLCDFVGVCGPREEERTARKDRPALASLLALRDLP